MSRRANWRGCFCKASATARNLTKAWRWSGDLIFTYFDIITRTWFDKETLRSAIEQRRQFLPDVSIELIRCITEGDTVVVEGRVEATAADGAQYDSPFVCICDTRDGLIVSMREYSDTRVAAAVFPQVS